MIAALALILAFAGGVSAAPIEPAVAGRDLMQRVNERPRPPASVRRMTLAIEHEGGRRIEREIIAYQLDDGRQTKTMYTVVAPAEMRGLAILRVEREGSETQWIQIEGVPEPVESEAIDPSVPFWGTEFTIGDVRERFWLDAYDFRLVGERVWRGRPCAIVEARVRDPRLGYRRVTGWIDRERALVLKAKYRDAHGRPLKVFSVGGVEQVGVGAYWAPHRLAMRNVKTRTTTTFLVTAAELPARLDDGLFTPAALRLRAGRCFPAPCADRP